MATFKAVIRKKRKDGYCPVYLRCVHNNKLRYINGEIKDVCKILGIAKEKQYCIYTFRHTWGTITQNDCGASLAEVIFGINHSHGFRVTRGYVKLDFTPAGELNAKLIDFSFFSSEKEQTRKSSGSQ